MASTTALEFGNTQQRSGSDAESTEPGPLLPEQLMVAAANSTMAGAAGPDGPVTPLFGRDADRMQCQAVDCSVDLRTTKPYCIKKRLCPEHLTAHAMRRKGHAKGFWRFCQQCGKLEPLEAFDGSKRSCRARLQKRRAHNTQKNADGWKNGKPPKSAHNFKAKELQQRQKLVPGGLATIVSMAADDAESAGEYDDEYMQEGEHMGAAAAVAAAAEGRYVDHDCSADINTPDDGHTVVKPPYGAYAPQPAWIQEFESVYKLKAAERALKIAQERDLAQQRSAYASTVTAATLAPEARVREAVMYRAAGAPWDSACGAAEVAEPVWQARSAAGSPLQQQQQGMSEAPSPESIAATLAAMAAGVEHTDQQQQLARQDQELQRSSLQEGSPRCCPEQQQAPWQPSTSVVPAAVASSYEHQLPPAAGCPPGAVRSVLQLPRLLAPAVSVQGMFNQHSSSVPEQQEEMMEVDTARAPQIATEAPTPTPAIMLAAAAAAAAEAAAEASHGPSSTLAKHHYKLQTLLDQLGSDGMTPQADAAVATLAVMRAQQTPAAAVGTGDAYKRGSEQQQFQGRLQDLSTCSLVAGGGAAAMTAPPVVARVSAPGAGNSPTPSGSSTHADPGAAAAAAAAAAAMQPQPEQHDMREQPKQVKNGDDTAYLINKAHQMPAQAPAVSRRVAMQRSPTTAAPSVAQPQMATAGSATNSGNLQPLAAAIVAALGAASNAGGGLSTTDGLGLLLSVGVNSLLSEVGDSTGSRGSQLLASILAQSPSAAAALLLAQQQQIQQLQAQQQQLLQQVAEQQEQYSLLLAALRGHKLTRASNAGFSGAV